MIKMKSKDYNSKYERDYNKKKKKENVIFMKKQKKFFKLKGYRIKLGGNGYILFEKEEDYLNLFCLEKVFFDFYNNLFLEKEGIRLFFRLTMIEKYIKSLSEFKIKILYDEDKSENPFKIKFPDISCGENYKTRDEIVDKMEVLEEKKKLENIPLIDKYFSVIELLHERISVEYFKRNMRICEVF